MVRCLLAGLIAWSALGGAAGSAYGQCQWGWAGGFGVPGVAGDTPFPTVRALAVFDDGSGPALYVGGDFDVAGTADASHVARWDGAVWSGVGEGLSSHVYALTVFDDGTGPALYAGLNGPPGLAKWDGASWTSIGVAVWVRSLAVFDDGSGPALFVAGNDSVRKWDGFAWTTIASGYNYDFAPTIDSLAVHDDGSGPGLYVGGHFTKIAGIDALNIARWNGTKWSDLEVGVAGGWDHNVTALTVFDDGTGPALYAGGEFIYAGAIVANGIARWDGALWRPVGAGFDQALVTALVVYDDGNGPALYAGGSFSSTGGDSALGFAKWDGSRWVGLGHAHATYAFCVFDDGHGPALYLGGDFTIAGAGGAYRIARWDGTGFSPLGDGNGLLSAATSLAVFDDGTGAALYATGSFRAAGITPVKPTAKWTGHGWWAVNGGTDYGGGAPLTVLDLGDGPALYGRGLPLQGPAPPVDARIVKWDGATWTALPGALVAQGSQPTTLLALATFDSGAGPELYAGGQFVTADGVPARNIARWNGAAWRAVSAGIVELGSGTKVGVRALAVFDDGTGPALYAGGQFSAAGGLSASAIAKWDATRWWPMGGGMTGVQTPYVACLAVFDDGHGPALYAGGYFSAAGGVSAQNIAKWDGAAWSPLGSGTDRPVLALTVFDDGSGPALYAGGTQRR